MYQPEELSRSEPLRWSPGSGTDVWELFIACVDGDLDTVTRLLNEKPDLIRCHHEYRTPLSFAVRHNRLDIAELLLDRGAATVMLGEPLDMARDRGFAEMEALLRRKLRELYAVSPDAEPLAQAMRDGELSRVRALLDANPDLINAADARMNLPIHWATMTRRLDLLDEMLARGADVNARRADGALPIHLVNGDYHYRGWRDVPESVKTTPDEVFTYLVANGAVVDLGMAACRGDVERVRELLRDDPASANRVSPYGSYYPGCGAPLKNAAIGGNMEIVQLLLDAGADPNLPEEGIAPRGHALYSAVYGRRHEIAKLLLEHGAFPTPPVESSADAVWIAIRNADMDMIRLLAAHGAVWEIPLELNGSLTYQEVAGTGLRRSLEVMLSNGDVAGARDALQKQPVLANDPQAFQAAATGGYREIVDLLLELQPDLVERTTVIRPPAMAEYLFSRGMNPSRSDWLGCTPLHRCAAEGNTEAATFLLDHGADLHARDDEWCSTPLGWAARTGKEGMVTLLLERGASATLPDDPPWATPMAWALKRGHQSIASMLRAQTGQAG